MNATQTAIFLPVPIKSVHSKSVMFMHKEEGNVRVLNWILQMTEIQELKYDLGDSQKHYVEAVICKY